MIIEDLNINWKADGLSTYDWPAMDKNGKIAIMVNESWGDLPKALLSNDNAKSLLNPFFEHIYEGLDEYSQYSYNKHGQTILDLYANNYTDLKKRKDVEKSVAKLSKQKVLLDEGLSAKKGVFVYYGFLDYEENYFLVDYIGKIKTGDYYRSYLPTIYASIEDLPKELWPVIVVSDTVDFTKDRIFDNDKISEYFPRMFS